MVDISGLIALFINKISKCYKVLKKEVKKRKSLQQELVNLKSLFQDIIKELQNLSGPSLYTKKIAFDKIRYVNICKNAEELVDTTLQNCCASLREFTEVCISRNNSIDEYTQMWEAAGLGPKEVSNNEPPSGHQPLNIKYRSLINNTEQFQAKCGSILQSIDEALNK
jgi:hypothetical protein